MVGKVTTSNDIAIKENVARQLFCLDGKGIKVGIISDSLNSLSGLNENVKSGDLPRKRILLDIACLGLFLQTLMSYYRMKVGH